MGGIVPVVRLRAYLGRVQQPQGARVCQREEEHALAVVEKLDALVNSVRYLVAIELMIATQAVDLRELDHAMLGHGPRRAYERVRAVVPVLDGDRALGPDIERIEALVRASRFGSA